MKGVHLVLSVTLLLLAAAAFTYTYENGLTWSSIKIVPGDSVNAVGGEVQGLEITFNVNLYWTGFYGNVTGLYSKENTSFIVNQSNNVKKLNLSLVNCKDTEIYFTDSIQHLTGSNPKFPEKASMNLHVAANYTEFDEYFYFHNLSGNDNIKAAATFTNNVSVNVGVNNLSVYGTTLNSSTGNYTIGILKNEYNEIVFVVPIVDRTGFNNGTTDFQIMLPLRPGFTNMTYYAYQDISDIDCGFNLGETTQVTYYPTTSPSSGAGGGTIVYVEKVVEVATESELSCPVVDVSSETVSAEQSEANDNIKDASRAIQEHPECLELTEILKKAERASQDGKFLEANLLARAVSRACSNLVGNAPTYELPGAESKTVAIDQALVEFGTAIMSVILAAAAFYFIRNKSNTTLTKRGKKRKK